MPNCRGRSNCIFSKFLHGIAFNNNNDDSPHYENVCKIPPVQPHIQLTVSKVLHFSSKTLETVNVLQKSHSFKPCTKAEYDFVKSSALGLMRFEFFFKVGEILS